MIFNNTNVFFKLCLLPIEYLYDCKVRILCGYFILDIF